MVALLGVAGVASIVRRDREAALRLAPALLLAGFMAWGASRRPTPEPLMLALVLAGFLSLHYSGAWERPLPRCSCRWRASPTSALVAAAARILYLAIQGPAPRGRVRSP
jgi:hypothetical protein